jgi:hypothetical protein
MIVYEGNIHVKAFLQKGEGNLICLNEPVGHVILTSETDVFGDLLTSSQHEIVAYRTS